MTAYELYYLLFLFWRRSIDYDCCGFIQRVIELNLNFFVKPKHLCKDSTINQQFKFYRRALHSGRDSKDLLNLTLNISRLLAYLVHPKLFIRGIHPHPFPSLTVFKDY